MKKLSPVLALSLATCAACGGGATGPSSTAPAGGTVIAWAGTASRTMRTDVGLLQSSTTWEVTGLTWVKDDGDLAPLGGGTIFKIGSGRVKQTITQVVGPCVAISQGEYALLPGDGQLIVNGSTYTGSFKRRTDDVLTVIGSCGFGVGTADIPDRFEMPIDGAADTAHSTSRLAGTSAITVLGTTNTAVWDFTATAWER